MSAAWRLRLKPIDPLVHLAFSVHSNKGAYALLVASGVSCAAQIPTGWEVVQDLTRKLAIASGDSETLDGLAWYRAKYEEEPTYSELLDRLGATPEERNNILRGYFEPTDEDRLQGLKVPTSAHHAIAELVRQGFVRVILTTNFDSLLVMALEAAGLRPTVLSTPDATEGALPLQFERCTGVKLNGDYRDLRIRNTIAELSAYDIRTSALLDRILDEYGLIVCGWSAEWDIALRSALERARSHRFQMFWAHRGPLEGRASQLIKLRRATALPINDADSFFRALAEKVDAIERSQQSHPLTLELAAASVKKYIREPRHVVALADLVQGETERLYAFVTNERFPVNSTDTQEQAELEVRRRVALFENAAAVLARIVATGCYWGASHHERIWSRCIQRLANFRSIGGYTVIPYVSLRSYPGVLALHAAGLAALSAGRYDTLRSVLVDAKMSDEEFRDQPVVAKLDASSALPIDWARKVLFGGKLQHSPMNDRVRDALRESLRDAEPDDKEYDNLFDHFEYLMSLKRFDHHRRTNIMGSPLIGRFCWHDSERRIFNKIFRDATDEGADYPPVKSNLFTSSEDLLALLKDYAEQVLPLASRRIY